MTETSTPFEAITLSVSDGIANAKDGMVRAVNLGDDLSFNTSHPIVNSDWRGYVDHLKGARKQAGASYSSDVVVVQA